MSKIEQNREKKKQAILAAAKSNFLSVGYTAASMDAIATEAKLTKQTLYRYFPSKFQLFQATLAKIGESFNDRYLQHLCLEDRREACVTFAQEFMAFHLSEEHIATQRLLIAESTQAPEIVESFMAMGAEPTSEALTTFFVERFDIPQPQTKIELWLAMLLAPRSGALLGLPALNREQIKQHAVEATDLLLSALESRSQKRT
ncbi:transcriptional regulator (TetR family protein) [Vibrio ichthyoenteri ATCC 700023]|uniref:Transcriptional regulator (TetR family protein) n=1 Tax=Vibrio ichthyoenteri ATCC 700023 TaxID=870968 RepID=F9S6Z7_9VIBR|nr:TetR/AcrR family transcriptional regulator [Vibrio ichthyoenteri]EGU32144.1 transcriptional regulator (TetR family protein) [Vibrio ichthyoenteri ATCC 700023]